MNSNFTAEIGRQQFLELFVTQVQHQDPLEPAGQEEFLQQLAQFSTVEGLENLNQQVSALHQAQLFSSGSSLLDRTVERPDGLAGVVSEVRQQNDEIVIRVDGQLIPLESVSVVSSSSE